MRSVVRFLFFTITYTVLCICVSGTEDLQGKKNFISADNSLDNFIEKGRIVEYFSTIRTRHPRQKRLLGICDESV